MLLRRVPKAAAVAVRQDDVTLLWHAAHVLLVLAVVGLVGNLHYRRTWHACR